LGIVAEALPFEVADAAAARAKVAELFPAAKVVCSVVPEIPGTRRIETVRDPHELADVDVGVMRSPLGVAKAGAISVTQAELVPEAVARLPPAGARNLSPRHLHKRNSTNAGCAVDSHSASYKTPVRSIGLVRLKLDGDHASRSCRSQPQPTDAVPPSPLDDFRGEPGFCPTAAWASSHLQG
jgi:hypothetical protein